jgi:TIR domain/SAM domain (Sterile alpha motif)
MGAAASVVDLDQISAEDVAKYVKALGNAYAEYEKILVDNGISGRFLASLADEKDVKASLNDIGITKAIHQNILCTHLMKIIKASPGMVASASAPAIVTTSNAQENLKWEPPNITVNDRVTRTPRDVMTSLFEIQGIKLDPSDMDPAVAKIKAVVGSGFGDGKTRYDVFINYRVAADADVAEKLYLSLKAEGVHAFLDKKCLKDGEKWKEGFLTGLRGSKYFLALISSAALARVRDSAQDHTWDNVLLEYETALKVL